MKVVWKLLKTDSNLNSPPFPSAYHRSGLNKLSKLSSPGKFGHQLNAFIREAFRTAEPTALDNLSKAYFESVTRNKFKEYVMNNGNLPSELNSASPLDIVNYCIYLMND